jgi:hypothetical protein
MIGARQFLLSGPYFYEHGDENARPFKNLFDF